MHPWFTVYFFGIGHPCYDQLTPVKTRYPLTSITWPYHGLKLTAHRGQVFFWSWPRTRCWFFDWIAGSCLVNLLNTGQETDGHFVCACARWDEYFVFGAKFGAIVILNALRRVFKRAIYVVRKILSREMKDYNNFTHISNTVDIHSVCRDFGWGYINHQSANRTK